MYKGGIIYPKTIAKHCAAAARDKKALCPIILKVKGLSDIAAYFVICSAASQRQIRALIDSIVEKMEKKGVFVLNNRIDRNNSWVVLDYGDVIVHIFSEEARKYYRLERLWGDAENVGF